MIPFGADANDQGSGADALLPDTETPTDAASDVKADDAWQAPDLAPDGANDATGDEGIDFDVGYLGETQADVATADAQSDILVDAGPCGAGVVCDDKNPCTTNECDNIKGCVYFANAATCDDGDLCTKGDICEKAKCIGKIAVICNDGDACTDDMCSPSKGCTTAFNSAKCSDDNACSIGDACSKGKCAAG